MAQRRTRGPQRRQKSDFSWIRELSLLSQLGITMVIFIGIFFAAGFFLDKWLGTKPIFSLLLMFAGIVSGGYTVYKQIMEVFNKPPGNKK